MPRMLIRKLVALSILILAVFFVGRLWYLAKDGFQINRIICPLSQEIGNDMQQPFIKGPYHYLGRGRQCYVFESADGQYVLKIPRFDRYRLPFFWKAMPQRFERKKRGIISGRINRMDFTFESFRIAATDLRDETAVVYLHLHATQNLPKVLICDRLHRSYEIDLNQTAFILQEKKSLMMPLFLNALKANDRQTAEKMLIAFLDIIDQRARKGIFNRDPSFLKNFGWDGQKSIQIDIGSFWRKPDLSADETYSVSMIEGCERMREYLAQIDPGMLQTFDRHFDEKLRSVR